MAKGKALKASASKSGAKAPPVDRLEWFSDARFGMFIHWGLYSIPARGEWIRSYERITNEDYQKYFEEFNPTRFNPAEWAQIAKNAGQKYAVLTAKHHEGFCVFDSKLTDYKATNTPAKRDLFREYVEAFRAAGLKVGLYYSLLDWHHPDYPVKGDKHHPQRDLPEDSPIKSEPRKFSRYVDYLHGQVRELLTNYGRIDVLWFDFSYDQLAGEAWRAKELVAMIRSLQPHIILNNRLLAGHENPDKRNALGDLHTPEQIIPAQGVKHADGSDALWEACVTMNNNWGYHKDDSHYKTPAQLLHMLVECVSKGGNLLLNVGPTAKGQIPPDSIAHLSMLGRWLDLNGESIYHCTRAPLAKPDWGRYTLSADGKTLYAHIFEKPIGPVALAGLAGKVSSARTLHDGAEINVSMPWNVAGNTTDVFLNFHSPILPDPLDTVVALRLSEVL